MLEIIDITKRFGGIVALKKVSLNIREGEVLGLIGPNGSGKTTLVNIISGLYMPDSGKIIYKGNDITKLPPYKRCRLGIARTYQIVRPFNNLTVIENVVVSVLNGKLHGKVSMRDAIMDISDRVIVLSGGIKIAEGKPEEIANDTRVIEAYIGDPEIALKFAKIRRGGGDTNT